MIRELENEKWPLAFGLWIVKFSVVSFKSIYSPLDVILNSVSSSFPFLILYCTPFLFLLLHILFLSPPIFSEYHFHYSYLVRVTRIIFPLLTPVYFFKLALFVSMYFWEFSLIEQFELLWCEKRKLLNFNTSSWFIWFEVRTRTRSHSKWASRLDVYCSKIIENY